MAFTVWDGPKGHDFFEMVLRAIGTHGNMQVDLPPAPPIFRFADRGESARVLAAIGLVDNQVSVLPLQWRAPSAGAVLDAIYKSTVRTAMLLEHQAPEARERIHQAILADAAKHAQGDAFIIGWPAVLVSARKPD
ncbi:MAG: hypothetical protein P4M09_13330 [Devosia sp.]|nr:hypothetical protein [Devosia sp.]